MHVAVPQPLEPRGPVTSPLHQEELQQPKESSRCLGQRDGTRMTTRLYETMFLLDNQLVREDWSKAKALVTDTLTKHGGKVL